MMGEGGGGGAKSSLPACFPSLPDPLPRLEFDGSCLEKAVYRLGRQRWIPGEISRGRVQTAAADSAGFMVD